MEIQFIRTVENLSLCKLNHRYYIDDSILNRISEPFKIDTVKILLEASDSYFKELCLELLEEN